ncbi:MAG TPA: glycoside hydrolase family 2 TIM barrel-domain containing protein [bacterium]|nr:glycoside hydrolase family 2 TIM barrel-domain containing protein [bacterium]
MNVSWSALRRAIAANAAAAGVLAFVPAAVAADAADDGSEPQTVRVVSDESGRRLVVGGRDFFVFGMNWGHMPIGQNYTYSLWAQPDDVIEDVLAREMPLLQGMGVNVIRQYVGIPPRWVRYIYERYGIWTVLNHSMARYGYTLDGVWIPSVDYSDPRLREAVKNEVLEIVREFQDTPGVLMWLLGNENNYGLTWKSAETEALPEGERQAARARHLYSLFGETIDAIHELDRSRPVAIANGDVQYVDLIAEECQGLDVFGTNVYRGISVRDLFQVVEEKLGTPVMFTEFGSDAWNAREMREDQEMQCKYLVGQWQEMYEQSAGKGRVGNAVGGLIFQWSDGWWKFGQESRLDIHDTNASWPNGGYVEDFVDGQNNMNEEWWGICAKGPPDDRFLYELYPRAAYYALRQAFLLDPYGPDTDIAAIRAHFRTIRPATYALQARGDRADLQTSEAVRGRLSGLRLEFETYSTGGSNISTPESPSESGGGRPAFQGFDQLQSFYADFEARPAGNLTGRLSLNFLARVPTNPIDETFYEQRAQGVDEDGNAVDLERLKVYQAEMRWEDPRFVLDGFYRTGHYHWGYEGDFFGLYREANYGENIDIYKAEAPSGFEIEARQALSGLKVAFGPELWWGANPTVMSKYTRVVRGVTATAIYQNDIADLGSITTSAAQPRPETRKATLHLATTVGPFGVEAGGIWAGDDRVGETFTVAERRFGYAGIDDSVRTEGYVALEDTVQSGSLDTFGGKLKVTWEKGRWHWYAQAARMGIVADAGPTQTITYTGWSLKDTGSGNQTNFLTGVAVNVGDFQVAPNFLWQKPLVGPVPGPGTLWVSPDSGFVPVAGQPRNVARLGDPFEVRANRETRGAELMLTYDPTPATWMWQWDAVQREDAPFAASVGLTYRDQPTTVDAFSAFFEVGDELIYGAFPGGTPPRELWEVRARVFSRLRPDLRVVANLYGGNAEPNGDSPREVKRVGGDVRAAFDRIVLETYAKFNDWGPYDYHRDFNLTFPLQLMGDVSYTFGRPTWLFLPQTKLGIRTTWRSLDQYSPRYCPAEVPGPDGLFDCDPLAPGDDGTEWEIRTYLHFVM